MKNLNLLKKYVPRHFRLGLCLSEPVLFDSVQDVVESVPVVDDFGSVVCTDFVLKSVPSHDVMQKYNVSAFRLAALVKAGVPLKVVNVNSTNSVTIDKLQDICQNLDNADKFVQKVLAQQKERESWFNVDEK